MTLCLIMLSVWHESKLMANWFTPSATINKGKTRTSNAVSLSIFSIITWNKSPIISVRFVWFPLCKKQHNALAKSFPDEEQSGQISSVETQECVVVVEPVACNSLTAHDCEMNWVFKVLSFADFAEHFGWNCIKKGECHSKHSVLYNVERTGDKEHVYSSLSLALLLKRSLTHPSLRLMSSISIPPVSQTV